MAFGINRQELKMWKDCVIKGNICFLTHYWQDARFPHAYTVTKVGCYDIEKLIQWGQRYDLKPEWIDQRNTYPHFDLFGERQRDILIKEKQWEQLKRFRLL
ncbi:hypothetical protein HNQ35_001162 [Cerasibacillus quisquiliarum]|mgnify:CR=1 FL=1|uniref:YneQ n=1 Tax=Cerasibacillus quisquiliarum TaxID=227865 RepID=A0A511UXL5_9BACI|nr:hypothetical protein [Cerasibacillus quisquiliarum]MBB5145961.1 hypothetical protein [Cerasibacillus quisquiliarum]GEN30531.1 hypothetical protein CQU01_07690 [Cerasibacillus quisquiliarum]